MAGAGRAGEVELAFVLRRGSRVPEPTVDQFASARERFIERLRAEPVRLHARRARGTDAASSAA